MNSIPLIDCPCVVCWRPALMWCNHCESAWYCTPEHLQSDWPRHLKECLTEPQAKVYHIITTPLLPAEQQGVTVPSILMSPKEGRRRIITVKCRPPEKVHCIWPGCSKIINKNGQTRHMNEVHLCKVKGVCIRCAMPFKRLYLKKDHEETCCV